MIKPTITIEMIIWVHKFVTSHTKVSHQPQVLPRVP